MKAKLLFLSLATLVCQSTFAQDYQQFIGTYIVQEVCTEQNSGYTTPVQEREIVIKSASVDMFDIQFNIGDYTLGSSVLNDTYFKTPQQTFLNSDETTLYISGEGFIKKDSLYYNYGSGGSGGLFDCVCKGVNKNATGTNKVSGTIFSISPNPAKEILKLDVRSTTTVFSDVYVRIYNAKATLVVEESISGKDSLFLNIAMLSSGIYILLLSRLILFFTQNSSLKNNQIATGIPTGSYFLTLYRADGSSARQTVQLVH